MAVRNFWVEAKIDGRTGLTTGGPGNKDGGMTVRIHQRNEGESVEVIRIDCWVLSDGSLKTQVWHNSVRCLEHATKR